MKNIFAAFLVVFSVVPGSADTFIPFTVDQATAQELQTYLNDSVPPRYGTPISQWLQRMETAAQAEAKKAAEDAAKKTEGAPAAKQ